MRRLLAPAFAGLAIVTFAACSPDESDFASEAESFIGDEDGDVASSVGLTFEDVECEEPASTETGAMFTCTATGSDGASYVFTNEITGDNEFEVVDMQPADGAATGDTSATATTTATS